MLEAVYVSIYRYNMQYMVLDGYVSVLAGCRQWYFTKCLFQSTGAIDAQGVFLLIIGLHPPNVEIY
jgi:hypothetical protein